MSKKSKRQQRLSNQHQAVKSQQQPIKKEPSKKVRSVTTPRSMTTWLLVFLTVFPFLFSRVTMDPVLSIRYTFLSGFVILFVIYFFAIRRKLVNASWPLLVKVIFALGIAYGLWNVVSMMGAVNKQQVYYGLARHFLDMILLFVFTTISEQEENSLLSVCKVLSLVGIGHFIIGISQFYGGGFTDLPGNYIPYSIMANRNLYGTAQVMLLPFAVYTTYKTVSGFWKGIGLLSIAGIIVSSIISQTRSSWLEALTMLVVSLVLIIIFSPANRKKWIIGTVSVFAFSFLVTFLLVKTDQEGEFAQSIRSRTIAASTTDTTGTTSTAAGNIAERFKIWRKTMEVIKDQPITGVGMGNWKITVAKYGSKGLAWEEGKYIPDSTHNDYLLVTAESGFPGALLYFGMWVLIAFTGFKTIRRTTSPENRVLPILMFSGLAGYAVDSLFSFPMERMEHGLYLFLMGGIILGLYMRSYNGNKRKSLPVGIVVFMILIAAFNMLIGFKKMSFEKYTGRAKSLEEQKAYQLAVTEGEKGKNGLVNIPPNGFPVEAYIGLAYKGLKKFPEALKEMDKALKYHPYNKALYVNKGTVYSDMQKFDTAIMFYKKALELTPKMEIIYFNLASSYFSNQDYKNCLDVLSKVDYKKEPALVNMKARAEAILAEQQKKPQ